MKSRPVIIAVAGLVVAAGAVLLWHGGTGTPSVRIAGTDAALPRATAESEFILPEALAAAREQAASGGARALIVHRRGHRVFEYFAPGLDGTHALHGGELAAAVLKLASLEPGQSAQADVTAALVSERLWLPLRAADAWLSGDGANHPRQCCIEARLDDWMRVGDLLAGLGAYQGERFVTADAVRELLAGQEAAGSTGDEPLLARDGVAFDLQPEARLWIAPRRNLAILVLGDAILAHNTLLPNIILRGLNDQAPAIGGDINDIVPGH
jgi:hypothetical protein